MSNYQKILYRVDQGIARLTLNRPAKRNALDADLIGEMKDALRQCSLDENVRIVLLAGAGADFCSGADLSALRRSAEAGVMENLADARRVADLFLTMRRHPRPIIAAVRGRALAGGCGLATASDIILAAESASFGYPEVNIGFIPAMVMAILRRSVSEKRAFELITTGQTITARAARDLGLINEVIPDAEFDNAVDSYVSKLAAQPPSAVSLAKTLFYQMDAMTLEAAIEAGIQANGLARQTEDFRRGLERFLKKA